MDKQKLGQALKDHTFFKGMKQDHLDMLADCGATASFAGGEVLFRQDEEADKFFVILEGRIGVDVSSADRGRVTIQTLEKGEILGWSWLFPPYLWHFNARAMSDTSCIVMDGKCLRSKLEHETGLGFELMKRFSAIIIDRLQATRMQLMDMYGAPSK
jgi:CRP-like cAMP-binding protein